MSESIEIQLVRLQEQLKNTIRDLEKLDLKLRSQGEKIGDLQNDIEDVKGKVTLHSPIVEKFSTLHNEFVGVKKFTNSLWMVGGLIAGLLVSMKEQIKNFFLN